jgi:hypothetical protein
MFHMAQVILALKPIDPLAGTEPDCPETEPVSSESNFADFCARVWSLEPEEAEARDWSEVWNQVVRRM